MFCCRHERPVSDRPNRKHLLAPPPPPPLMLGGCFIYQSGWASARPDKGRCACVRGGGTAWQHKRPQQTSTLLITNTRLTKSFENVENLKLEPHGRHKASKMEDFRDAESLRLPRHRDFRANESITLMKEYLPRREGSADSSQNCPGCGEQPDYRYPSPPTLTDPFKPSRPGEASGWSSTYSTWQLTHDQLHTDH